MGQAGGRRLDSTIIADEVVRVSYGEPGAAERPIDDSVVFISFSSNDEALVKRLHADLQAAGAARLHRMTCG